MARGRKPKPTKLKILAGNPGQRPLNHNEPKPDATMPKCPAWLSAEAKAVWRQVGKELHRIGVLTIVDANVLAAYCVAFATFKVASEQLDRDGLTYVSERGLVKTHPANNIRSDAMRSMWGVCTSGLPAQPIAEPRIWSGRIKRMFGWDGGAGKALGMPRTPSAASQRRRKRILHMGN